MRAISNDHAGHICPTGPRFPTLALELPKAWSQQQPQVTMLTQTVKTCYVFVLFFNLFVLISQHVLANKHAW